MHHINQALRAHHLFKKDVDYVVKDNEIIIVDEFTGRLMPGRRWSDGLHQAIEAKENLPIQDESQTLASISYQNLFLLYEQLSGMTGTAKTEEGEFEKIYNLSVVQIPTNRDIKRKDLSDLIYKNQYIKWRCIAQECLDMYNIGRPVLIGTTTIEKSELLAALLSEYKVPYRLLNARPENVESESEIVSQAGCKNAITIATNMAGRGTDILLGGNATFLTADVIKDIFDKKNDLVQANELTFRDIDQLKSSVSTNSAAIQTITNPAPQIVKNTNSPVTVQNSKPQVTYTQIKTTKPAIPFINTLGNQYLSLSPHTNKLPPEIARMIQ